MSKTKKQRPVWMVFLCGLCVALGVYLVGHLLLAALAVRGAVGEEGAFTVTAILCLCASLCGGACVVRRCPWGPLPGGGLTALLFCGVLALVGSLCWEELALAGNGGVLVVFALAGGVAAGLLGARRRKPKRRSQL